MFAGIVASNRKNGGKTDKGERATGKGAISATSNVA
jgi:hypothetical protein